MAPSVPSTSEFLTTPSLFPRCYNRFDVRKDNGDESHEGWYKRSIEVNLTRVGLLVVSGALILSGIACSGGQVGSTTEKLSGSERVLARQVGNNIGDLAPEFSILLTNGESISHFRNARVPTFLYFFSPN